MKTKIHVLAAITATLCIATFFASSFIIELFGTYHSIATVKGLIVMPGLFILIPAMAVTGGTGFALGKNRQGALLNMKKKRMLFIGANGLLILLPAAIVLNQWASAGLFDSRFYLVQSLELLAGGVNLTLMGMNIRDGLKIAR